MEQETLIYIDDKEKLDAGAAANSFAQKDVKNRAYINTLGAELLMKYLSSENVDTSNIYNMHSIKKILEEIDISDVMLPGIHIDVRVVFDENAIFIPKSHFDYNLVPDIYVVLHLAKDFSNVKFLGFFEPKLINKNNSNDKYYFIEKEKLSSPLDLVNYIERNKKSVSEISDDDIEDSESIIVSMADNDISESDKKHLFAQLIRSAKLRDKFIEYENFETLSYKAMTDDLIEKPELPQDTAEVDEFDMFDSTEDEILPETSDEITDEIPEEISVDDVVEDNVVEEISDVTSNEISEEIVGEIGDEVTDEVPPEDVSDINIEPLDENSENIVEGLIEDVAQIAGAEETIGAVDTAVDILETTGELLNIDETIESPAAENVEVETMSLDDINFEEEQSAPDEVAVEDKLSIDDIEFSESVEDEIPEPETMSLDNIDVADESAEETQDIDSEAISADEKLSLDDTEFEAPIEDTPIVEETISFEALESAQNQENIEETSEESEEVSDLDEIVDENTDQTFGQNLLDNLAAEESDNIEGFEPDTNITSDELLSQIDDVLSSSAQAESEDEYPTEVLEDYEETYDEANNSEETEEDDKLNVLFNDDDPVSDTELEEIAEFEETAERPVPGAALMNNKANSQKTVLVAAAIVAVIAVAGAFTMLKPKNNTDVEPLANNEVNLPVEQKEETTENILATNAPEVEQPKKQVQPTQVKELKSSNTTAKPASSGAYMSVNRIVWDVPDTLSYNTKMQNYLRTAGKSIKLSLSTDLLLANEYAYTNQVKLSLKLSKTGSVEDARVISGSGSSQIDNIVLQSVKETLNVVKPPSDAVSAPNFNLSLIIYF